MNAKDVKISKQLFCEVAPDGKHVMLDIETMGPPPRAVVLEVAAVGFNPDDASDVGPIFYRSFNLDDVVQRGYELSASTHEWWQEQERYSEVIVGPHNFVESMTELNKFLGQFDKIWAKSPSFDCSCLKHVFRKEDIDPEWGFKNRRNFRDVRTALDRPAVRDLIPVEQLEKWDYKRMHSPMADCLWQIRGLFDYGFLPASKNNDLRSVAKPVSDELIEAWSNDFYNFEKIS